MGCNPRDFQMNLSGDDEWDEQPWKWRDNQDFVRAYGKDLYDNIAWRVRANCEFEGEFTREK